MATTIVLKNSVTTTNAPSSLAQGEVAINVTDKKVWVGNAATTPVQIVNGGPDGVFTSVTDSGLTNTRVTYAGAGGLLKDSASITTDGTTITAAFSGAHNGTVGATTPAAGTFTTVSASSTISSSSTISATSTITATGGFVVGSAAAPTFSAYQSSAQGIPNGTYTKISFQTEEWDTASAFDNATNYRFTPLVAGYYQVSGGASILQLINNTSMQVVIYKNGSAYKEGSSGASSASFYPRANMSALVYLNGSTDYIELWVAHNFGLTYNLSATISATYFQAVFVRSA